METIRKSPETSSGPKRVLVVEDDVRIRDIVSRILQSNGYLVTQASNGEEAVNMADAADVVLVDLLMPKMSGEEFMKKIRGDGNYVPVVIMSAVLDRSKAVERCEEYGIVDFMQKPFRAQDLMEKVRKAAHLADDLKFVRKATDRVKGFIERQARV